MPIQPQITGVLTVAFFGLIASLGYFFNFGFEGGFIYFFMSLVVIVGALLIREIWGKSIPADDKAQESERKPKAVFIGFGKPRASHFGYGAALGGAFAALSIYGFSIGTPAGASLLSTETPLLALDNKFLIIVLMAPAVEEVTFRSTAYSWLYNKYGNVHIGALVTAVGFSLYHYIAYGPYLQTAFIAAGLFGFAAAEVGAATGSLWAPWFGHTLYNAVVFGQTFGFAIVLALAVAPAIWKFAVVPGLCLWSERNPIWRTKAG